MTPHTQQGQEVDMQKLQQDGWLMFDSVLEELFLDRLRSDLVVAERICREVRERPGIASSAARPDFSLEGSAHHILPFGESFMDLLEKRPYFHVIENYLESKIILNSFGAVINQKDVKMYTHAMTIHRDLRTFTDRYEEMMVLLVMLDEFTEDNGATYLLSGSHKLPGLPDEEAFYGKAVRAVGKAGSLAVFDARLWHVAGKNLTNRPRRGLTLTFTRPNFKPQFDFARNLGSERCEGLSDNLKQLVGYYARVPQNHEEWYQNPENYFYKGDQG